MQDQLHELCGQFEQVLVASLVSKSSPSAALAASPDDADESLRPSHDVVNSLFAQAFAAAMERCGGLGLRDEMYRSLMQVRL
jgi:Rod binding domain-containing protein